MKCPKCHNNTLEKTIINGILYGYYCTICDKETLEELTQ